MDKTRAVRFLTFGLVVGSMVYLLQASWFRWGNLIIDTYRDQWIFYKLSQGKVLYKDLFYIYGFLPAYLISFIYRIFGVRLVCQAVVGALVTAVSAMFVYRIARFYLNRFFSTLVSLNFLFAFAFGCYSYSGIFNFILPYSISATFFIASVLAASFFLIKFIRKERLDSLLWWALCIYFAYLCRFDITFVVWASSVFAGVVYIFDKRRYAVAAVLFLPVAAAFISYWVFLTLSGGLAGFKESLIEILKLGATGQNKFELFITGLSDLSNNLKVVARSLLFQFIAFGAFYFMSKGLRGLKKGKADGFFDIVSYLVLGLISFFISLAVAKHMIYFEQYRLMPVVLLLGLIGSFIGLGNKKTRKESLCFLAIFMISSVLILRVVFRATPNRYGFFLLVPGLICYYLFFIRFYPGLLSKFMSFDLKSRRYYYLCISVFFIVLTFFFARQSNMFYRSKTFSAVTDKGTLYSFNDQTSRRFWQAVVYMRENTPPDATLVVFPEGIGINFFSDRDNPLRYHTFLPPQITTLGQDYLVKQLKEHDIDYIIILTRLAADYQQLRFGADYGKKIYSRIQGDYQVEKVIGPYPFTSPEFGVAIFRKK